MHGVLVINKESGYTSRDVINVLNKKFNTKKMGHTGTLDPIATGVMVVCIGKYTKLVDMITSYDKEYVATIRLGIRTDTLDSTGEILEQNNVLDVDNSILIDTLNSFLGTSMQEVPKYAAVKINGKKLYEYARDGEEVELPKREINISEIELLENKHGEIRFRVVVSKGTYIRSLIRDICGKLGVLGTMSSLTRTRQGHFTINDASTLQDVDNYNYKLLTLEDLFSYSYYDLNDEEYKKISNGVPLHLDNGEPYYFLRYQNQVVGICELKNDVYKSSFRL